MQYFIDSLRPAGVSAALTTLFELSHKGIISQDHWCSELRLPGVGNGRSSSGSTSNFEPGSLLFTSEQIEVGSFSFKLRYLSSLSLISL